MDDDKRISTLGLDTDLKRLVRLLFQPMRMAWSLRSTVAREALR
ncbi:hypothetical protein [Corallococcus sp. EGB]|nr:hypothetical protein [Corallococcus sp. EGB]